MGQSCSKRPAEESAQAAPEPAVNRGATEESKSPDAAVVFPAAASSAAPLDPSCGRRWSESAFADASAASFPSALSVPDPVADPLFADAHRLLVEGLRILDSLLHRYAGVHVGAQRSPLWQECAEIAAHGQEETESRASVVSVRHMAAVAAAVIRIAHRPLTLLPLQLPPPPEVRPWILRVDALFTQIAEAVPQMQLIPEQAQFLLASALHAGALPLVPVLMRDASQRGFDLDLNLNSTFVSLALSRTWHEVPLQPYLRLFEFGLDPTLLSEDSSKPLSPLQSARNWVRDHPAPAVAAMALAESQQPPHSIAAAAASAAMEPAEHKQVEAEAIPSVLPLWAAHQYDPAADVQQQRRAALYSQFMHALIPAWGAHSTKVRSLLLDAAPDRLIPPLVDIVARYLDLEGVTPEREAPAEESAEMED